MLISSIHGMDFSSILKKIISRTFFLAPPATEIIGITTNLNFFNGQLCPEVTAWSCSLTTNDNTFTVIRFYFKGGNKSVQIDGQNHPAGFELQYTDNLFISKGEYTLSEPVEGLSENITRTLTVNNEELYNLGYRHIGCGTLNMNLASLPLDLDREGTLACIECKHIVCNYLFFIVPTRPKLTSVDLLVVNTTSPLSAQIRTSSMVHV